MLESTVILAALGIVATISGALVWLLKKLFTQNEDTIKQNTNATLKLSDSINALSAASSRQVQSLEHQEKANQEWQQYVIGRFDGLESLSHKILTQEIKEQTVEHQTVINQGE